VSGKIYISSLQEVAEFQSTHRGIGTFNFTPLENETYSAKIELPNGTYNSYPLPTIKSTGITMTIHNTFQSDSCEIIIQATPDIAAGTYSLIGQSRGKALFGANFNLGKDPLRLKISKDIFPSGITKFTLIGPGNN